MTRKDTSLRAALERIAARDEQQKSLGKLLQELKTGPDSDPYGFDSGDDGDGPVNENADFSPFSHEDTQEPGIPLVYQKGALRLDESEDPFEQEPSLKRTIATTISRTLSAVCIGSVFAAAVYAYVNSGEPDAPEKFPCRLSDVNCGPR